MEAETSRVQINNHLIMKNILTVAIWIAVAGAVIGGLWYLYDSVSRVVSNGTTVVQNVGGGITTGQYSYLDAGTNVVQPSGNPAATTSEMFVSSASLMGSTTITGYLEGSSVLGLDVQARASSSVAVLNIVIQTKRRSADDWFSISQVPLATTTASVTVADTQYSTSLATTTSNWIRKHITFPGITGEFYRVNMWVTGTNASIWAQAAPQIGIPN